MTIQEDLRAALAADAELVGLVGDRIYPGEVPDDEQPEPTPLLVYQVPESTPMLETLDGGPVDVLSEVLYHVVAADYETAVAVVKRVEAVADNYRSRVVRLAWWAGTSEGETEDGHLHTVRYQVQWVRGMTVVTPTAPPPPPPPPVEEEWTPADLVGLAPSIQVARSVAGGLCWQDAAKTLPATEDGHPVRAITCPDTGLDWTAPGDAARPLLWEEGPGRWWLFFDGVDDVLTAPNAGNLSSYFGSGAGSVCIRGVSAPSGPWMFGSSHSSGGAYDDFGGTSYSGWLRSARVEGFDAPDLPADTALTLLYRSSASTYTRRSNGTEDMVTTPLFHGGDLWLAGRSWANSNVRIAAILPIDGYITDQVAEQLETYSATL